MYYISYINRETLFQRLEQYNISAKLLKMIKNMYSKLKCQVRTSAGISDHFSQANGVMQGECLSPTLFAAYINEIERLMNNNDEMGVHVNGVKLSVIMYADDLVLIAKKKHGLQVKLQLCMNALYKYCIGNSYFLYAIFIPWLACDIDKLLFCMVSLSLTFFLQLYRKYYVFGWLMFK